MSSMNFQGLDLQISGNVATITIERTFDEGGKRDEWSQSILDLCDQSRHNVQQFVVDLGKCPIISSTVIAGLVHLYDHSNRHFDKPVTLRHCTNHVVRIMEMMHLKQFFEFTDILTKN